MSGVGADAANLVAVLETFVIDSTGESAKLYMAVIGMEAIATATARAHKRVKE